MSRYKDFPPGWNHILVPTASRTTAHIGLAMYTPCRWKGELSQNIAWAGVRMFGPGVLPGRTVSWDPPEPRDRWERLMRRIRKSVGDFDHHVVYERREGRPGVMLVLIRNAAAVAFVKIRMEDDAAISREARSLGLVAATKHPTFSAPQLMMSGEMEGWSYLVTSPLPPGRHRMHTNGPPPGLFSDVKAALTGLEPDPDVPDHWSPMHGDLTPWNLRTFGRGAWLIDWENTAWGPPGADEVLYRATTEALGRPLPPAPIDASFAEAVHYWVGEVEERSEERKRDDLPPEDIDARILDALRSMGARTVEQM